MDGFDDDKFDDRDDIPADKGEGGGAKKPGARLGMNPLRAASSSSTGSRRELPTGPSMPMNPMAGATAGPVVLGGPGVPPSSGLVNVLQRYALFMRRSDLTIKIPVASLCEKLVTKKLCRRPLIWYFYSAIAQGLIIIIAGAMFGQQNKNEDNKDHLYTILAGVAVLLAGLGGTGYMVYVAWRTTPPPDDFNRLKHIRDTIGTGLDGELQILDLESCDVSGQLRVPPVVAYHSLSIVSMFSPACASAAAGQQLH